MAQCRFKLRIGDYYLAPRPSIDVIEPDDFFSVTTKDGAGDSGCTNCGGGDVISRRELVLKLRYKGRGSLATAWHMYNRVETVLSAGCATNKQIGFERRVCDEDYQRYNIRASWQTPVDVWTQKTCDRILTVELHLVLVTYNVDKLFDFGAGPFNPSFA